jgi:hypothetical protein
MSPKDIDVMTLRLPLDITDPNTFSYCEQLMFIGF